MGEEVKRMVLLSLRSARETELGISNLQWGQSQ